MNRKTFQQLRHNLRASGYSWNGGKRLMQSPNGGPADYVSGSVPKNADIALVFSTLLTQYDKPVELELVDTQSVHKYMRLVNEWRQWNANGRRQDRTLIWWRNYIRSAVRRDKRWFTEQLVGY